MTDFYFRKGGNCFKAERYFKEGLTQFIDILTLTKKYIEEELHQEIQPTEINYVNYPYLGEELFKDERIATDMLVDKKDEFNHIAGFAIYVQDESDQNLILKEGYRNLRIVYISIVEDYTIIENILNVIHELNHFIDPFDSSINFVEKFHSRGYEQNTNEFIQFNVRKIFNEYYANYRAYKYLNIILINLKIKEFDIQDILVHADYNLHNSLIQFEDRLISLKSMEDNYYRFNQFLVFFFYFYENIFKFLGKWYGLPNIKEINSTFKNIWEHFKKEIEENSLKFIIDFLDLIETLITPSFKDEGNLSEVYNLFYGIASNYKLIIKSI